MPGEPVGLVGSGGYQLAQDVVQDALRMRMLAKVPRIITSWLPRREP